MGGSGTGGNSLRRVTVTSVRPVSSNARVLTLDWRPRFTPGQMLSLCDRESTPPRLYSIASAPTDPGLEVLYNTVPGGVLTPVLDGLGPGDSLLASQPRGEFTDRGGQAWWIANGTGVAPFISMYRAGIRAEKTLIHGARTPEDLYYSELFSAPHEKFSYVPCLSRSGSAGSAGKNLQNMIYPGRLSSWLDERIAAGELDNAEARKRWYYLCGSEQMILYVRQSLISAGIPFTNIISEIYF